MTPTAHEVAESNFVPPESCKERHDRLERVLYDSPEGLFPRVRALEMSMVKVFTVAALGSAIGGGFIAVVVGVAVHFITRGGK